MLHWRSWLSLAVLYGAIGAAGLALAVESELTPAHATGALAGAIVAGAFWLLWQGRIPAHLPLVEGAEPVELTDLTETPDVRPRWRGRVAGLLKGGALLLFLLVLSDRISGQDSDFLEAFALAFAAGALPLGMALVQALDRIPRKRPLD